MLSKRRKTEAEVAEYELSREIARMFGSKGTRADPGVPNIFDFLPPDILDKIMAFFYRGSSEQIRRGLKVPFRMRNMLVDPPVWFDMLAGPGIHKTVAGSKKLPGTVSIADLIDGGITPDNLADITSGVTTEYMPIQMYSDPSGIMKNRLNHQKTSLWFPRQFYPLFSGDVHNDAVIRGGGVARGEPEEGKWLGPLMYPSIIDVVLSELGLNGLDHLYSIQSDLY